jgi:pimeloyl-ACP methyl ester carboxylesterase
MRARQLPIRGGDSTFEIEVAEAGAGSPLLFLHGEAGPRWSAFQDALAVSRRVVAPSHPGFGGSTGGERLLDLSDLVYYYLDFLDQMRLRALPLVGHGLGGMVAAELAAVQPDRFSHLVLIAPFGLWLPDSPTLDYFAAAPPDLARALYHDPGSAPARAAAEAPTDESAAIDVALDRARSLASAAKYLWPIPDRGLERRLHRVAAPTLLIWGESDGVVPVAYGPAFQARLPGARLEIVPSAGHLPHEEQPERVAALVTRFVG